MYTGGENLSSPVPPEIKLPYTIGSEVSEVEAIAMARKHGRYQTAAAKYRPDNAIREAYLVFEECVCYSTAVGFETRRIVRRGQ